MVSLLILSFLYSLFPEALLKHPNVLCVENGDKWVMTCGAFFNCRIIGRSVGGWVRHGVPEEEKL